MFKETSEGQTHSFNDGCGEPEHNKDMKKEKISGKMMGKKPFRVQDLIDKAVKKENKAWREGARCHSCGKEKSPVGLSDTCRDCFENL